MATGCAMAQAGLSPRRALFDPRTVSFGFKVDKVALGQGFLLVFEFSPINFTPIMLHTYFFIYQRHYVNLATADSCDA
jgi:hypothetical protein